MYEVFKEFLTVQSFFNPLGRGNENSVVVVNNQISIVKKLIKFFRTDQKSVTEQLHNPSERSFLFFNVTSKEFLGIQLPKVLVFFCNFQVRKM